MTKVNFQTPNLIVAHYLRGGGGKFLLNCLGVSQQVVLQDQELAEKQILGQLTPLEKQQLLLSRTNDTEKTWEDLNLGCVQLFGDLVWYNPSKIEFNPVISTLSNSNFKFCVIAHIYSRLTTITRLWTNATVIQFVNERNFINAVRPVTKWAVPSDVDIFWANVRGTSWPVSAPQDLASYQLLPEFIKNEIAELHDNKILTYYQEDENHKKISNELMETRPYFVWDCNWFLDENETIKHIKELYQNLNLDDFNEELIRPFYRAWFSKLIALKTNAGLV